jgi:cellulose synthase/poly-beta-1,6-N-acetylglucosamine synthase-like glycosyltransferase
MLSLGRAVVVMVISAVVTVVALIAAAGQLIKGSHEPTQPVEVTVWGHVTLVQLSLPPTSLFVAAGLAMLVVVAGAITFEAGAFLRTFRNPERRALQTVLPPWTHPLERGAQPVRITILVPAHNEEASLPVTLAALAKQTRSPDRVIVVADNCTDRTADIAREFGYEAFETVGNTHKKGGALNQALGKILPGMGADDAVMVMDADTSIGPHYLETASARLDADPDLEAVGGIFFGEPGHGLIGIFQRNEYRRYSQEISRRRGRVFVLTGTA